MSFSCVVISPLSFYNWIHVLFKLYYNMMLWGISSCSVMFSFLHALFYFRWFSPLDVICLQLPCNFFHFPHAWAAVWIHYFCCNIIWHDFLMSHPESSVFFPLKDKVKKNESFIFYSLFSSLSELHEGMGRWLRLI